MRSESTEADDIYVAEQIVEYHQGLMLPSPPDLGFAIVDVTEAYPPQCRETKTDTTTPMLWMRIYFYEERATGLSILNMLNVPADNIQSCSRPELFQWHLVPSSLRCERLEWPREVQRID